MIRKKSFKDGSWRKSESFKFLFSIRPLDVPKLIFAAEGLLGAILRVASDFLFPVKNYYLLAWACAKLQASQWSGMAIAVSRCEIKTLSASFRGVVCAKINVFILFTVALTTVTKNPCFSLPYVLLQSKFGLDLVICPCCLRCVYTSHAETTPVCTSQEHIPPGTVFFQLTKPCMHSLRLVIHHSTYLLWKLYILWSVAS